MASGQAYAVQSAPTSHVCTHPARVRALWPGGWIASCSSKHVHKNSMTKAGMCHRFKNDSTKTSKGNAYCDTYYGMHRATQ